MESHETSKLTAAGFLVLSIPFKVIMAKALLRHLMGFTKINKGPKILHHCKVKTYCKESVKSCNWN